MATPARKRLLSEFKRLQEDPPSGVMGCPKDDNIMIWDAVILGLMDSPFEDGSFKLIMRFTEDYPNRPPLVKFKCKMFHPNVFEDGTICLDILQERWSPAFDIGSILVCIQLLLDDPNPEDLANPDAGILYKENRQEYLKKVQTIVEESWRYRATCDDLIMWH